MVLAAALTWAAHSSVAIVLLVMSFATKGVVPPDTAFALVLGANLGTAINPCLEGGAGDDPAARRLPIGNLLTRVAGVLVVLPLLGLLGSRLVLLEPSVSRAVADFHTGFNLVVAAVFMAVLPGFAKLLRRILPSRLVETDLSRPLYLDRSALETPFLALGCATREALRLADFLGEMLSDVARAIEKAERHAIGKAKRVGAVLGKLDGAVTAYLAELDPEGLSDEDRRRASQVALFATNLGHAADVVERNLLVLAARRIKRGLDLPKDEQETLRIALERLEGDIRSAATVFITGDLRAARLLAAEKEAFRDIEARATADQLSHLREGRLDREQGTLFLELLRDMKRVNMHLVAAGAYPVLEGEGELLPTRLRRGLAQADEAGRRRRGPGLTQPRRTKPRQAATVYRRRATGDRRPRRTRKVSDADTTHDAGGRRNLGVRRRPGPRALPADFRSRCPTTRGGAGSRRRLSRCCVARGPNVRSRAR